MRRFCMQPVEMSDVDPVRDQQQQLQPELSAEEQQQLTEVVQEMLSRDFEPYRGCDTHVWRAAVMVLYLCYVAIHLGMSPAGFNVDLAAVDIASLLCTAGLLSEVSGAAASGDSFLVLTAAIAQELLTQLEALWGVEQEHGSSSMLWYVLASHFWDVAFTVDFFGKLLKGMHGNQLYEQSITTLGCLSMVVGDGESIMLQPAALLFVVLSHQHMYSTLQRWSHKRKALREFCADSLFYRNSTAVAASIDVLHRLYGPGVDAVLWKHSMQDLLLFMFNALYESMLVVPVLPAAPAPVAIDITQRQKLYYILCWAVRKMMQWVHRKKHGWDVDMHEALNHMVWKSQQDLAAARGSDVALLCTLVDEGKLIYVKQPLLSAVEILDMAIRPFFTDIRLVHKYTFSECADICQEQP